MHAYRVPRSAALFATLLALLLAACATTQPPIVPPTPTVPDATLALEANGTFAWRFTSVDGEGATAATGTDNAPLTLEVGKRYRFENPGVADHPLAMVDAGRARLLTQDPSETGSFENDPDVDYEEDGNAIEFTLTADLAAELDGYLCTVHAIMFGTVTTN